MKVAGIVVAFVAAICIAWSFEQASSQKRVADAYAIGHMNGECRVVQMQVAKPKGSAPAYIGTPFVKANSLCDSLYPATR